MIVADVTQALREAVSGSLSRASCDEAVPGPSRHREILNGFRSGSRIRIRAVLNRFQEQSRRTCGRKVLTI